MTIKMSKLAHWSNPDQALYGNQYLSWMTQQRMVLWLPNCGPKLGRDRETLICKEPITAVISSKSHITCHQSLTTSCNMLSVSNHSYSMSIIFVTCLLSLTVFCGMVYTENYVCLLVMSGASALVLQAYFPIFKSHMLGFNLHSHGGEKWQQLNCSQVMDN